ncbi:MAG TPA: DUF4382 domain-containing protein [Gemmatimonadaceae bacterium]|jgi:hypothetical protein|nr:DUF4382 domain-containing protein [Gemmatimonadaceae bacterium]
MKRHFGALAALAIAGTLGLAACDDANGPTLTNSGKVNVLLTDAPFPLSEVKSVNIFVTRIDAKLADTDSAEAADTDNSGWTTLVSPNQSINLLTLTNGQTSNLGVATIPVGTYKSFRMIIDADQSNITLNDDTKPEIKWPSAGKNGIKIMLDEPFDVIDGTTTLLVDFDVGRSFVMRGNSISQNGLLFKPVIHATTQQNTGTITGSVRADNASGAGIAGATVEVLKAGTPLNDTQSNSVVRTGVTDASGNFTLAFVPAGTYAVRATPTVASGYKPALLTGGAVVTTGTTLSNQVIIVTK